MLNNRFPEGRMKARESWEQAGYQTHTEITAMRADLLRSPIGLKYCSFPPPDKPRDPHSHSVILGLPLLGGNPA